MSNWTDNTRSSQSGLWHGKLRPMLEDDPTWDPIYRGLVGAVAAAWTTVALIALAAWAQTTFPAASQHSPADGTTPPVSVEAAAGATGDRP